MNASERYNRMIEIIENGVEKQRTIEEILTKLSGMELFDRRVLAEVFKFMTGMSAVEYIKERQLMRAYRYLIEDGGEINYAIDYSGLANHSSFTKRFKARFGITPSEAKLKRDVSLYQKPLNWSVISSNCYEREDTSMNISKAAVYKFGIEQDKLRRYNEAMEMQALYGFSEAETEIAFDYALKNKVPMHKAFEYIDAGIGSLIIDGDDSQKAKVVLSKDVLWQINRYAEMLQFICEHSELPFKKADHLVFSIHSYIGKISEESLPEILLYEKYMESFFNFGDFQIVYEHFINNHGDMNWWEDYIQNIREGFEFGDAFDIARQEYEDFMEFIDESSEDSMDEDDLIYDDSFSMDPYDLARHDTQEYSDMLEYGEYDAYDEML